MKIENSNLFYYICNMGISKMKNILFYSLIFMFLFSCKKELEESSVKIESFQYSKVEDLAFQISYKLIVSGNPQVIENGIIFTTNPKPEFLNQKFKNTNFSSNFKQFNLSKLEAETEYYTQAYVITKKDTIFSEVLNFKTGVYFTDGEAVTDFDGNVYKTVIIGEQQWMSENLRTTHFSNGDSIMKLDSLAEWVISSPNPSWYNYDFNSQNDSIYAKMYNGYAIMDARNVCPTGWHVATENDWTKLILFLGNDNYVAGKIKSTGNIEEGNGLWEYPNAYATNSSGLNVLPGGYHDYIFYNKNEVVIFAKVNGSLYTAFNLYSWSGKFHFSNTGMQYGTYVRCVKN
jgi:uncharacterized protein (TIGR02145 family)